MQTRNDDSLVLCVLLGALLMAAPVLWVVEVTGVPWEIATIAIFKCIIGVVLFGVLLFFRFYTGLVIVNYSYPLLLAYFWGIVIPFLDYWAAENANYRTYLPREEVFYGSAWFQYGVLAVILFGGYGLIFYLNQRRL